MGIVYIEVLGEHCTNIRQASMEFSIVNMFFFNYCSFRWIWRQLRASILRVESLRASQRVMAENDMKQITEIPCNSIHSEKRPSLKKKLARSLKRNLFSHANQLRDPYISFPKF